jgi:predicted RNase H-like nuclease (RuvC/YqgF family)
MANEIAIAALVRKRAELAGEVIRCEREISRLRTQIASLDATIRIFDPEQVPARIRPVIKVKRRVVPTLRRGEFGRLVLAQLRVATEPLSVAEIVERLAASHGIDISTPKARLEIIKKARRCLADQRQETVTKVRRGGSVVWTVT